METLGGFFEAPDPRPRDLETNHRLKNTDLRGCSILKGLVFLTSETSGGRLFVTVLADVLQGCSHQNAWQSNLNHRDCLA